MMKIRLTYFTVLALLFLTISPAFSQSDQFQVANRLIDEQNYEEALSILDELVSEYPDAGIFFDRLLDCLVNLKMFEDAIQRIESRLSDENSPQLTIRLAEFYHYDGETDRAFEVWDNLLSGQSNNLQVYFNVGNSLEALREYNKAISVYNSARESFNDQQIFTNELANAYLQTGNFNEAIQEYINLIRINPGMLGSVQQKLLSMQDEEMYRIAAIQLEDYLIELETDDISYNIIHQLLTWMLMETDQYERALVNGRQYESRTELTTYSLYSIATQLLSNNQFELAAEAFGYYVSDNSNSIRFQALEQQANVYLQWANYLKDHNLSTYERRAELIQTAYELNGRLLQDSPDFSNIRNILVTQTEIALDEFSDPIKASHWISILQNDVSTGGSAEIELNYVMGRIHLYEGAYTEARQYFSRANNEAVESAMIDKTRYFLSLTDFYSGEYEFARLQLRSLERRNSSFYANDALKLGMWIQQGSLSDSTGEKLNVFSEFLNHLSKRQYDEATRQLILMVDPQHHPLLEHALVEASKLATPDYIPLILTLISTFNAEEPDSPFRERLLWEEATLSRVLYSRSRQILPENETRLPNELMDYMDEQSPLFTEVNPPTAEQLTSLYEAIIIEYPNGFYAPYSREILRTELERDI